MSLHLGRGAPRGYSFVKLVRARRLTLLHYLKDVLISVDENSLGDAAAIRFDGAKPDAKIAATILSVSFMA